MYTKGEVIWAKIKGFPWWPGVIAKVIEDPDDPSSILEVLVNFIGENSHAQLNMDKVAKFQDKYNEFAKMKKKKLLEAIEIANKIVKGETTFKVESMKVGGQGLSTQTPKRKKSTKPNQKSPQNKEGDTDEESESVQTSENEEDSPPQLSKTRSKQKSAENKPIKRQNSTPMEKTPAVNKNGKSRVGDKREPEEHKDSEEPKLTKSRKLNDESELPDQINGKIERHISAPPLTNKANSNLNKEVVPVSKSGPLDYKDFDIIRNLIIERIANVGKNEPVSGTILEKSIENVISKINPDAVTVAEIIEKGIGRHIYTVIVMLDELTKHAPKSGMNIENELGDLRNKLAIYNERIKDKLVSQFVENDDTCIPWLKKIDQKQDKSNSHKDMIQEIPKSKGKNNKLDKVNELAEEEESLEDKNSAQGLQMDFEEYRFEGDKKKALADKNKMTSTKVTKPIYNTNKNDNKQKENVVINPNLRKKICVKMSKIMQEKYGLTREAAQTLTLKVENRIRSVNSDMGSDYKNKILVVLKLLKFSKDEIEQYANDFSKDFYILEEKLDTYQQQNADLQLDAPFGDDSPPSTKEISREVSIINGKIC